MSILDQLATAGATADARIDALVAAKSGQGIAACIPARNEAATIASVIEVIAHLRNSGLVDELVVVDDGSTDMTSAQARGAGATVVTNRRGTGKGQALRTGLAATDAEIVVFLDADVTNFRPEFVTDLVAPLLHDRALQLVKATYSRPLDGRVDEGGRVNELVARPLLRRFFPALVSIAQPLSGECAIRRTALERLALTDGYGIEIGLLIDVYRHHGLDAIAQADLGERVHRNRPLRELRPHADDVLAAVLARTDRHHPTGHKP